MRNRRLRVCRWLIQSQSIPFSAGLQAAAGLASWYLVNRRIRYMVLGIFFSSMIFKVKYGLGLEGGDAHVVFSSGGLRRVMPAMN